MGFNQFHFSHPTWLWGLVAIPMMIGLYVLWRQGKSSARKLERFADKHLLPHLIKTTKTTDRALWMPLIVWSLAWAMGIAALAGPQWRYTDMQVYKPEKDLVIVLDLSRSMNATDVKPSRLARAREEITDLIGMNHGLTIGLVAYADVPHMVVPLTDDMHTLLNLLPSLDTSLITIDGDRLQPALAMASRMLGAEPGHDKSILVVSDGDFEENAMADLAQAADGATIYTLAVGTEEGAPIPDAHDGWVKNNNGKIFLDRLHADRLQELSAAGHGVYVKASYNNNDIYALLNRISGTSDNQKVAGKTVRAWDEGFYVPALILAFLLLPFFRKGQIFPALIIFMLMAVPSHHAFAAGLADWFRNPAQQGQAEFSQGHYDAALSKFSDPYQQGVAAYKAGHYDKAATLFKAASGDGMSAPDATYNLGNAQLMQNQPEAAIASYDAVLKQEPNDAKAKHNLEIARKMLQQQQNQQQQQQAENKSGAGQNSSDNSKNQQGKNEQSDDQKSQTQSAQNGTKNGSQANQSQQQSSAQSQQGQNAQNQTSQSSSPSQNKDNAQGQAGSQTQSAQNQASQTSQQPQSASPQQQMDAAKTNSPSEAGKPQGPAQAQPQSQAQSSQSTPEQRQPGSQAQNMPGDIPEGRGDQRIPSQYDPTSASARTQRDVNADQWLNHIQSDPGSFLKNQFAIEEQEAASRHEAMP